MLDNEKKKKISLSKEIKTNLEITNINEISENENVSELGRTKKKGRLVLTLLLVANVVVLLVWATLLYININQKKVTDDTVAQELPSNSAEESTEIDKRNSKYRLEQLKVISDDSGTVNSKFETIGSDDMNYKGGVIASLVRNKKEKELTWTTNTFKVEGDVNHFQAKLKLISNEGNEGFNSNIDVYADEQLMASYLVTDSSSDIDVDVYFELAKTITISLYDNKASTGTTSIGIVDTNLLFDESSDVIEKAFYSQDLSPFADKYWVIYSNDYENGRVEAASFSSSVAPSNLSLIWNKKIELNDYTGATIKRYYHENNTEWTLIGEYDCPADDAINIIAANLNIYDVNGNIIFEKIRYQDVKWLNTKNDAPFFQKYWVVFTEGNRGNRLEAASVDSCIDDDKLHIIWDNKIELNDFSGSGKCNQYYLDNENKWENFAFGAYIRLSDSATNIIASNLDVYDRQGNLIIKKCRYADIDWEKEIKLNTINNIVVAIDKIGDIDCVSIDSKEVIDNARRAYNSAKDIDKELIKNYDHLVNAEEKIKEIAEANKETTPPSTTSAKVNSNASNHNSGMASNSKKKTCIACHGFGEVEQYYTNDPTELPHWEVCQLCKGKGYYYE